MRRTWHLNPWLWSGTDYFWHWVMCLIKLHQNFKTFFLQFDHWHGNFNVSNIQKNMLEKKTILFMPIGVLDQGLRTIDHQLGPPSTWAEICHRTCLHSHQNIWTPKTFDTWKLWTAENAWHLTIFEPRNFLPPKFFTPQHFSYKALSFYSWKNNQYSTLTKLNHK